MTSLKEEDTKDNTMKNIVFDIQRFCLNDGPGIRTTVFLKGCNLNCKWFHNPESKLNIPQIMLNESKCTSCLECFNICSCHFIDENGKHQINRNKCSTCGKCVDACSGALEICGKEMTAKEIIDIVLKDKAFYENSGGGLTISGGDPLYNIEFTKNILIEAKKYNLHTAIETSGYCSKEKLIEIIPYVDLFLYDYKETDLSLHKEFTGVSNEAIINNLFILNELKKPIILRCPIIPSFNDRGEHFRSIGEIAEKLENILRIEILPYHLLGKDKFNHLGIKYELKDIYPADEKTIEGYIKNIMRHTNKKVVKG